MIVQNLDDFLILRIKKVDYRCYIVGMNKKGAISLLNNSALDNKRVLQWILNQIKHLLK